MTYHQCRTEAAKVPLLRRGDGSRPKTCPQCGSPLHHVLWRRAPRRWRRRCKSSFPGAGRRAWTWIPPRGKDAHQKILSDLCAGETRGADRHADDRQGAGFSQGDAGGGGGGGHYPESAGLPERRAHLSAAYPGGGPGRAGRETPGRVVVQTYEPEHYASARWPPSRITGLSTAGRSTCGARGLVSALYRDRPLRLLPRTRRRTPGAGRRRTETLKAAYIDGCGAYAGTSCRCAPWKRPFALCADRNIALAGVPEAVRLRPIRRPILWRIWTGCGGETGGRGVRAEMEVNPANMI